MIFKKMSLFALLLGTVGLIAQSCLAQEESAKNIYRLAVENSDRSEADVARLSKASDKRSLEPSNESVRFTYSDLVLRFAVPALREAIDRNVRLDVAALVKRLKGLKPTRTMESK